MGSVYIVDKYGEGHFELDWQDISDAEQEKALKISNPKANQMSGKWMMYDGSMWCWVGPIA